MIKELDPVVWNGNPFCIVKKVSEDGSKAVIQTSLIHGGVMLPEEAIVVSTAELEKYTNDHIDFRCHPVDE